MAFKPLSQSILHWGYTLISLAIISVLSDLGWRLASGLSVAVPVDMGVVIAELSMALSGFAILTIAGAVAKLETRIMTLESSTTK